MTRSFAKLFLAALLLSGCATRETRDAKHEVASLYSAASPTFKQATGSLLTGGSYVAGNSITTYVNGREIFPPMLAAIHSARRTIDFETYVMWNGEIARRFADALAERARAGVQVNAILDSQGTGKMGSDNLEKMRAAGVHTVKYHPLALWDPRKYNNRTHRKLLVIDGKVGFIGGVGIADEWLGNGDSPDHWRDNHYRVTGPVVAQIQGAFMDNWLKAEGTVLHGPDYFPALAATGSNSAQVFWSSPRLGNMDVHLMYLLAMASAQRSLLIENAYFVPDALMRKELIASAKRGARVEIIVPGKHIDQKIVRTASRKYWPELIRAGVHIYEYQPAMDHTKLMIVDGTFVSVGSANFDLRTVRLNDEANMNVVDRSFAAQQARVFAQDKQRSREITLDEAGKMGLANPIEQVASIVSPEL
ncbi:MAG: phospholipase D-like domain-containing protein [Verrucomicrobiota bacterium]|nr:phospholipase D-like domain-containing protein [Verrucomicrobiota bacterium]